jgi:hypothetical protein
VGGVDGAALGAVHGGGVQQLDVLPDILGRESDAAVVSRAADGEGTVGVMALDVPGVAVLNPVSSVVREPCGRGEAVDLPAAA